MRVVHFADKNRFNHFVNSHPLGSIHQTYEWAQFQAKVKGREKSWTLAVLDEQNTIRATAVLIRQKLPLGYSWLYSPRGPLVSFQTSVYDLLFEEIKKIARQEKAIFLRMDPLIELASGTEIQTTESSDDNTWLLPHFRPAHANYQPEWTSKIDLTQNEDDILKNMKPKGRYNIKLAEKKGVKIITPNKHLPLETAVEYFYKLLQETTDRDQFFGHLKAYYLDLLTTLPGPAHFPKMTNHECPHARLYLAYFEDKPIAGIIVTFFKDTATYYYGASSNHYRQLMAPYLLHWQTILDAKKMGLKWLDLFGIAPANTPHHPWHGVTEFKKKFGGTIYHYAPAQEYVFKRLKYWLMLTGKRSVKAKQ